MGMKEYHKIETVFNRNIDGTKKLIEGDFRSETLEYLKDCTFVWTEKVDGCVSSDTKLCLADGGYITISEVVDKKLEVEILGYRDGDIVRSRVVGWHKNGITNEWYQIRISRRGLGTKGNYYKIIRCTGNHKFYSNGEYIRADELKVGMDLTFMRETRELTYTQRQILTGLIIGDGSRCDKEGRSVEFSHKLEHEGYVNWLLDSLGCIAGNMQKHRTSGYGTEIVPARTISCYQIKEFLDQFYKDGKKIIPKSVRLSPISLAIIYMDDGSLAHSDGQIDRCAISLNDYDEESVDNLIEALDVQFGLHAVKFFSKGWNIRFNIDNAGALQTLIAPYICKCMQYKLTEQYRMDNVNPIPQSEIETVNNLVTAEIIDIIKEDTPKMRYDITTETHNYFANNILVHNCNIRVNWDGHKVTLGGRTDKAQIPVDLVNFLTEKFCTNEAEELFEQKFGETEVTLYGEGYGRKIQGVGSLYIPDGVSFIMFDVMIGGVWLKREDVEYIATCFGVDVVPIVGEGTIAEAVEYVKTHEKSVISEKAPMEGIVCRPKVELLDRMGRRVIVKIKRRDFVTS